MFAEARQKVTILEADRSLLLKLGDLKLDRVLSDDAIKKAEAVISLASNDFYLDSVNESIKLKAYAAALEAGRDAQQNLRRIEASAFALKTKAGQSGYDLVAALAKSLHLRCEAADAAFLTPTFKKIVVWHAQSIGKLLSINIKGMGGAVGQAILAETQRLDEATNH